ncbi:hypothetical protein J1614_008776 [Plenodomus biglobosus]|nr:hypothetical protein J1614_008776 [Plenodomus biglobosus]
MAIPLSFHQAEAIARGLGRRDDNIMRGAIAGKLPRAAELAIGSSTATRAEGLFLERRKYVPVTGLAG